MRLARIFLALAITVSLAMLPLGATAGVGHAMPSDDMQTAINMADHGDMSMDDCCPDDTVRKDKKCGMGFCCVGGVLALGDIRPLALAHFAITADEIAIPTDQVLAYRGGSPPFRPPRS